MPSYGGEYRALHELYNQLKEVQDQLTRGPRQIKIRQGRVTEAEAQLAEREQELKDARTTTDRKNLDLRSKESHLNDLQGKLNTASSNREYDIIRGQIEADKAAKAVLEDEILEWLDRVDAGQKAVAAAKQRIKDLEADARSFANEFEVKAATLHKQEASLRQKIAIAEQIIPNELKEQYRRLVDAYGADSMASVQKGVCNFCYVSLTPQSRVQIGLGRLLFCPSCGRLLYPGEKNSDEG
ncbi:zinc ribbon domain-containing protein [Planctomicrobium sp. SH664]|uniref:zinc ribbon domain-containing protein n=1 Tax=Planctomicrobium sp. SH664 TaxID=3448125 RepID=UPI003F5C9502